MVIISMSEYFNKDLLVSMRNSDQLEDNGQWNSTQGCNSLGGRLWSLKKKCISIAKDFSYATQVGLHI